ncbi:Variant surface glycoprotein [Trypanosoma congolense IL3000]|uniref:Variant surface glycoprotein n=1 Tax=Trypanosoma congolense (strain IL3000) TaxID=1068625 RepID=F9W986_TRYCI|nr:Variant surface glycoprotein [Trypanosoma congolense IL3000]
MMTMMVWMVMIVFFGVVAGEEKKNYNEAEHKALCDLLRVAVDKWGEVEKRVPTDPLRKALETTLFGYGTVGTLETLKSGLPSDYNDVEGTDSPRSNWCGQPLSGQYQDSYPRWPGYSAPHDVVCLCTAGSHGWPINKTGKLCAQDKDTLKTDSEWWSGTNNTHKKDAIGNTWEVTVKRCLSGSSQEKDLKKALKKFTDEIKHKIEGGENFYVLGENGSDYIESPCNGSPRNGLCVMYHPNDTDTKTWWKDLDEALEKDEQIQKQREEKERRRQKENAEKKDSAQKEAPSAHITTNQTDQQHTGSTPTDKLRRLNPTSGTPISRPSSWLLSAILLI